MKKAEAGSVPKAKCLKTVGHCGRHSDERPNFLAPHYFEKGCWYGNYDRCSWQTLGTGQFKPLTGSTPYLGQKDEIQKEFTWVNTMIGHVKMQ